MTCRSLALAGLVLFVGGLVVVVALTGMFVSGIGRFLTVSHPLTSADAIVVLGGERSDFTRTKEALRLYGAGYAPVVVFSGGTLRDLGVACSSAQLSLDAAQQLGLPAEAAYIADEAQSTYDEGINLGRLAKERGWRTLILVTDPFHTRRAALTFRKLAPGIAILLSPAPDPRYDPVRWWRSEYGLLAVVNEVIKLGFYWVQYGIAPM